MSGLVQQIPTFIGLVVGALGSYLISAASDRARWRRERDTRWDLHRMQTYAAYGNAVKAVTLLARRIAAQRGFGEVVETLSMEDGLAKLTDAESSRGVLWEQVLLLGDPATITAARGWHEVAWRMTRFARGLDHGPDAWARTLVDVEDARTAFYVAARRDIGIAGQAPATTWSRGTPPAPAEAGGTE